MKQSRHIHFGACALLAIAVISGCNKAKRDDVLARVGDREIGIEEFNKELAARQAGNPVPVDAKLLLEELVIRETYVQTARKAGLEADRQVQEQIRDVLIAKIKERVLGPQLESATVSDAEVKSDYEARRAEFTTPERAHLAVLFLQASTEDAATVRGQLENVRNQARQGSPIRQVSLAPERGFGALAVQNSHDQETRYKGGDLGWVERARHPQRIEAVAIEAGFALKDHGAVSEVIQGEQGFYLVKLLERRPPSVLPLETVAPAIQAGLLRKKREQIETNFAVKLREGVPVEVHPERLPVGAATSQPAVNLPPKLP